MTQHNPGVPWRTHITTSLLRAARRAIGGAVVFALIATGLVFGGATAANAAPGDYSLSLTGPESGTIGLGETYNYVATLQFDGVDSSNPATGVVLTTTLPEGTEFTSVPTGPDTTVASYTYDPATRLLTLTLNDTTESVVSIAYTVSQVDNTQKYEGMPLTTSMSGSGGPSGPVDSNDVTTLVQGDNDYSAAKSASTIVGSDNRTVTYRFNIATSHSDTRTTFTSWSQTLTDTLPAGAQLVDASPSWNNGSWDTSAFPTVTWNRTGAYGPSGNQIDATGRQIWLTVYYPENVAGWELGQLPPLNTVDLSTEDRIGASHDNSPGQAQGPAFGPTGGVTVGATKGEAGLGTSAGAVTHGTIVRGSYLGPGSTPNADQLTLTDSGAAGETNESWFNHFATQSMTVNFSPNLTSLDLPYRFEYQIDGSSTWAEYTGYQVASGRTGQALSLVIQNTGSVGWSNPTLDVLNIPVGSTLTGWRVTVAPGAETVPVGAEVTVRMNTIPVFRGIDEGVQPANAPAAVSPGPQTNTATVQAGAISNTAASTITPTDSVYVTTHVDAPTALSVGGSGVVKAGIVNQNPSETYSDSTMSVVLPCGVLYDPSQPITTEPSTVGVPATPAVGSGVTVDATGRVTNADGCEQQVVKFSFDTLPPMRSPWTANSRQAEQFGWTYAIPVTAVAQAYNPSDNSVETTSWATSADPRFLSVADGGTAATTVPMAGYGPFFSQDAYNFDPARNSIGEDNDVTTINTAGGLLISKLSGASPTGPWGLNTTVGTEAYWQILVNDILPNPVTNIAFFDKLPATADGDDFDVQLSGAVTGAPAGSTVEYSTNATSATTGTWTGTAEGATAFRVTVPTLTNGNTFTLVVPTDLVGDTSYGDTADNLVAAAGTYNGNPVAFTSNPAQVNVAATPSMSIVKTTNGAEYSAAPGATVATGSTVTWGYTVTNTGNAPLDQVAIADAFTDGAGTTGSITPTSTVSGPLAPGATRTFTATGTAIAGQYHNTATATAVAVDADGATLPQAVPPVSDESWYLAGDTGLTVVKTTNGQDVSSAPGLPLTPGDDVTWQYVVTNTGSIDLVDVLVTDVDADGNTVFSETIPALAAGSSVTLDAAGTVIEGQYHNTVTASAENPVDGDAPLSGSDDSWYFGVAAGLTIDKLVSAGESGPWSESATVASGSTVYWQIVVTNTGNSELTDVTVTDATLSGIDPIGTLAPGESATIVVPQKNVTAGYTNTATVTGVDSAGATLTDSDTAKVEVTEVPVAVVGGLALTGSGAAWTLSAAALLLLAGAGFMLWRRRKASEA